MKSKYLVGSIMAVVVIAFLYYAIPLIRDIYTNLKIYNERQARKNDYTQITTPLDEIVVKDICVKFEISTTDKRCQPNTVVYSPEFFDDIKAYIRNLSDQNATYQTVQDKLGDYLTECEKPNNEGHYRCQYDLRGDYLYRIAIYFSSDGHIYRIMDNRGGS